MAIFSRLSRQLSLLRNFSPILHVRRQLTVTFCLRLSARHQQSKHIQPLYHLAVITIFITKHNRLFFHSFVSLVLFARCKSQRIYAPQPQSLRGQSFRPPKKASSLSNNKKIHNKQSTTQAFFRQQYCSTWNNI